MDFLRLSTNIKCTFLIFGIFLTATCVLEPISKAEDNIRLTGAKSLQDLDVEDRVSMPTGKEVVISIRKVEPRKAVVTISNTSDVDVYTSYIPGGSDKFAVHAILVEEKMDPVTGEFQPWGGGHLGTGLHALAAHDSFNDFFFVPQRGKYRISVRYIVDSKLAKRINTLSKLSEVDRIDEEKRIANLREIATHTISSDPFDL